MGIQRVSQVSPSSVASEACPWFRCCDTQLVEERVHLGTLGWGKSGWGLKHRPQKSSAPRLAFHDLLGVLF